MHKVCSKLWIHLCAVHQLPDKPDMIINFFATCAVSDHQQAYCSDLLEGKKFSDSKDNQFTDKLQELTSKFDFLSQTQLFLQVRICQLANRLSSVGKVGTFGKGLKFPE